MGEITNANFGLLIAYLLPGFVALWGVAPFSKTVAAWLQGAGANPPTVSGFLYVTIASLGLGMVINALRWLTIERLHRCTGIRYPQWDFSRLQDRLSAYTTLVEFYYRYHEFFGNSLIAVTFVYSTWRYSHPGWQFLPADAAYACLTWLLWLGSRDTLKKYYERSETLLRRP